MLTQSVMVLIEVCVLIVIFLVPVPTRVAFYLGSQLWLSKSQGLHCNVAMQYTRMYMFFPRSLLTPLPQHLVLLTLRGRRMILGKD